MSLRRQLWRIFGPLIVAMLALLVLLLAPLGFSKMSSARLNQAASSLSVNVLKGEAVKKQAFASKKYVPFIGSSELSRMDAFHPSVLAKKYHRAYQPFLLGGPGTQSLTQYFSLQGTGQALNRRKAVVVLSPQWFVRHGASKDMFRYYYSPLQTITFLKHAQNTVMDRYAAKRLLQMPSGHANKILEGALTNVAAGKTISSSQSFYIHHVQGRILKTEDNLFSHFNIQNRQHRIDKGLHQLPAAYDYQQLNQLAMRMGQKETSNNPFQVKNRFYSHRIQPMAAKLQGSQRHFDYSKGPEYGDFQLLLNQFSQQKMAVLFIIPPVNQKWANYTGLPTATLKAFDRKITYQLNSQGFHHIADLSQDGHQSYFMQDTIHLGWRGWLSADQKIAPFLKDTTSEPVHYHIQPYFYSQAWQNKQL